METNQYVDPQDPIGMLSGRRVKFTLSVPAKIARYWLKYKDENPRGLSNTVVRETLPFFQDLYGNEIPGIEGDDPEMKKTLSRQILETVLPAMYDDISDGFQYFDFSYFSKLMSRPPLCILETYIIRRYWNNLIELGYFIPSPENSKVVTLSEDLIKAEGRLEGLQ